RRSPPARPRTTLTSTNPKRQRGPPAGAMPTALRGHARASCTACPRKAVGMAPLGSSALTFRACIPVLLFHAPRERRACFMTPKQIALLVCGGVTAALALVALLMFIRH